MRPIRAVAAAGAMLFVAASAFGAPLQHRETLLNVDWKAVGVGGVGGGSGTFDLPGACAPVRQAWLYWQGIDLTCPPNCRLGGGACSDPCPEAGDGVYDNEIVIFHGVEVTGEALGDGPTNCWGEGSSRAFRADVTHLVGGAGSYSVSGLSAKAGHSANGASLVVVYDDGVPANDRHLMFFEGNDANAAGGFPGETDGWRVEVPEVEYSEGTVKAQLHVADGQAGADNPLAFTTTTGGITIPDTPGYWDGQSVPNAGASRWPASALWDIHDFDITEAFAEVGPQSLWVDMPGSSYDPDCHALVLMTVDFAGDPLPACVGDCDGGGGVEINELILGVNIALGNLPVSQCPAMVPDHSGKVTVAALVQAVGNSLEGCAPAL